jgi:Tfp pilus assembly protein PilO
VKKSAPNPKLFMMMTLGMAVLGAAACYFAYSGMTAKADEVAQLKTEVKDAKTVHKELDDSKVQLDECAAKLKHLEASLPDFAYVPTLLAELERVGKENGIAVVGVRPVAKPAVVKKDDETGDGQARERKPYQELNIEVKGRGSYGSAMRFVQALQSFPKIVAARSVSLNPKSDPSLPAATLDVSIELRAYVFQPKPEKADKPVQVAKLGVKHHAG